MTTAMLVSRTQPYHSGHHAIVTEALKQCDRLILAIGSANLSGSLKNPLSYQERVKYIKDCIEEHNPEFPSRIKITFINDYYDDNDWNNALSKIIKNENVDKLFYHDKGDGSSDWVKDIDIHLTYYTNKKIDFIDIDTNSTISATELRTNILSGKNYDNHDWDKYRQYAKDIEQYKNQFHNPFSKNNTSTFFTTDVLLRYYPNHDSNDFYILLIKRNKGFGGGKYAMIGGFVETWESPEEASLREFTEETGIGQDFFKRENLSLKYVSRYFDDPNHSDRGRIITKVFCYELTMEGFKELQEFISEFGENDEVSELRLVHSSEYLNGGIEHNMFENHAKIIHEMLKL